MKKKLLYFALAICLFSGCSSSANAPSKIASTEKSSEDITSEQNDSIKIDSFRDYQWGTSLDDIRSKEITADMKEDIDYSEESESDFKGISITHGDVAGYDASIGFVFENDKLEAGGYLVNEKNDKVYSDLFKKYSSKYGTPVISTESVGWGPCHIWIDNDKNFICFNDLSGISYVSKDCSSYINELNDLLKEFYKIDLIESLNQIGNTDGI